MMQWLKSDWLSNTQSRVLQSDWLILENSEKSTLNINMPYCVYDPKASIEACDSEMKIALHFSLLLF